MSGSRFSMLNKGSILSGRFERLVFAALFFFAVIPPSLAQVALQTGALSTVGSAAPPPDFSTITKLPARDPNAIAVDGWLLYPTLRLYTLYSDNLFFTPVNPLPAGAIGVTPSIAAVWSNGIHTTTLYGNIDRQDYPTANEVNTLD